MGKINSFY